MLLLIFCIFFTFPIQTSLRMSPGPASSSNCWIFFLIKKRWRINEMKVAEMPAWVLQKRKIVAAKIPVFWILVFGPPGSGSVSQRYRSGSFHHQTKIVRKTFISTVLWLLYDVLSLKNDINVLLKSTITVICNKKIFLVRVLKVTDEKCRIRIRTKMSRIRKHCKQNTYTYLLPVLSCPLFFSFEPKHQGLPVL